MYQERAAGLPHAIAWRSVTPPDGRVKRILPDGCMDLIWADGQLIVAGPDTVAHLATPPAGSHSLALRFAAGSGPAVFGVPADELTDRRIPLEELWPAPLVRRLAAVTSVDELERVVRRRWAPPDPAMVDVARRARAGQPVDAIAVALGLSPRHLQRRVRAAFGYGPKMLARILRLQRALGLARRGRPFAEVSVTAGYADQAHLARDVKALAGVPLGQLVPA
ncbi:MAG TPA: helix-turn-helix transcriptional regulator [Actinoplanes sp.]|nr:helix-turn-helix transcriptional regulator [Actinoplanes sp.]